MSLWRLDPGTPEVPHELPKWIHCESAELNTNNPGCPESARSGGRKRRYLRQKAAEQCFAAQTPGSFLFLCNMFSEQIPPPLPQCSTELRQLTSWNLTWSRFIITKDDVVAAFLGISRSTHPIYETEAVTRLTVCRQPVGLSAAAPQKVFRPLHCVVL